MNDERTRQLVLKFASERRCTLESFEAGPNAELVAEIGRRARQRVRCGVARRRVRFRKIALAAGCVSRRGRPAAAAALSAGAAHGRRRRRARRSRRLLASSLIDDVDRWVGARQWEEALLHLYQQLLETRREPAVRVLARSARTRHRTRRSRVRGLRAPRRCSRSVRSMMPTALTPSSASRRSAGSNSAPTSWPSCRAARRAGWTS